MIGRRKVLAKSGPQFRFSSAVIHCIFITSSSVFLACALVGFGVTCKLVGSCPEKLPAIVFGIAGGLLVISVVLLVRICRKKRKESSKSEAAASFEVKNGDIRTDEMDRSTAVTLPEEYTATQLNCSEDGNAANKSSLNKEDVVADVMKSDVSIEDIDLIQKSADVSYWIEQQEVAPVECCPLEITEATKTEEMDGQSEGSEVTAL